MRSRSLPDVGYTVIPPSSSGLSACFSRSFCVFTAAFDPRISVVISSCGRGLSSKKSADGCPLIMPARTRTAPVCLACELLPSLSGGRSRHPGGIW